MMVRIKDAAKILPLGRQARMHQEYLDAPPPPITPAAPARMANLRRNVGELMAGGPVALLALGLLLTAAWTGVLLWYALSLAANLI